MNWIDSIEIEATARLQAEANRLWQEWIRAFCDDPEELKP